MPENGYPQSDLEAIEWVENNIDEEIRVFFDTNYKEACEELKEKKINIPDDDEDFSKIKKELKDYFDKDGFINSLKCYLEYNDEDITDIKNKLELENKEITDDDKITIIKMYRYYNMFLKYGHSAKATWVANEIFNNILINAKNNGIEIYKNETELKDDIKVLKKIILSSAFLHDIGRFYQAINYNTLIDGEMMQEEKEIISKSGNLKVNHAIAGYYYSLAKAYNLTIDKDPEKSKEKFIIETLTALTVRFHSEPNTKLSHFEFGSFIEAIKEDGTLVESLYDFTVNCYKSMGTTSEEKERYAILLPYTFKDFVENVINKTKNKINEIIKEKENNENEGFLINEEVEKTVNVITAKVEDLIKKYYKTKSLRILLSLIIPNLLAKLQKE